MTTHYLTKLFEPHSIALIGASEHPGSIGTKIVHHLQTQNYQGKVFFVNPKYKSLHQQKCYSSLEQIKESIDLALIATPANTIPKIIAECGNKNIKHVIILSSGFSETSNEGRMLEQHILNIAKGYHIHLVGPNCLGIIRPHIGMHASFTDAHVKPGNLALVSQSGTLTAAVLDWAEEKNLGFSAIVSVGNSIDIDFTDVLDFLITDPFTESILLYIEEIKNARKFMSAIRAAARMKPVIMIKAGKYAYLENATLHHDDVFNAALKRAGALRVHTIEDLFSAAKILGSKARVHDSQLAIITNGGGAGVMAVDKAIELNIHLSILSEEKIALLSKMMPSQWRNQNLIDIIGDATPERYQQALQVLVDDPSIKNILVILMPVSTSQPLKVAEVITKIAHQTKKLIIACWIGGKSVKSSRSYFNEQGIPCFNTPEKAVQAFSYLANHALNQKLLLQVPEPICSQSKPHIKQAKEIICNVLSNHRSKLTDAESNELLNTFHIHLNEFKNASIKISMATDPIFGPIIIIENDGTRGLALPPLNPYVAKKLLEEVSIVDAEKMINLLLRISEFVCEIQEIETIHIDFSKTLANIEIITANEHARKYQHMAIHPYPRDLVKQHKLHDGVSITIRPIRPEDAAITQEFVRKLSSQSKYFRFMQHLRELTHDALIRLTQIDYDREMTFIATSTEQSEECIGVAHYITNPDRESCEFAIVVSDQWHNKGIGSRLMIALCDQAKQQGLNRMMGLVIATNTSMLEMVQNLGFEISDDQDPTVKVVTKIF